MRQVRSHTRSGQSLVEALIAISLLLVGFLGTITLINRSIGLTRVVADSYVGTYLAAEGIEVTKSLIDANYVAGRPYYEGFQACASTCDWELDANSTWESGRPTEYAGRTLWYDPIVRAYSYAPFGTATTYKRKVSVTLTGPNAKEIVVISRVEWRARGGGDSSVTLEDHFYDWGGAGTASTSSTSTAE
jgi:Tfp pilus assembly protein PilV